MAKALDFYFFIGSTYSYLSVFRAESLCAQRGIALNWKPFSVRTIMIEQNNRPFADKPIKTRYMWRDIERRAVKFGAPFFGAPMYPIDQEELANLVATVAATEGWCADFARATYETWFVGKRDPGAPGELSAMLERLGKDPVATIATAKHADTLQRYKNATDQARALGIFGSPTFVSGTEVFWGDDRLEDALDWIEQGVD
ncbi:MAG TPA: DsbA family protein [Casimicrobium sp.]|nr:DsbA family protein [Casimicrobium sp.]